MRRFAIAMLLFTLGCRTSSLEPVRAMCERAVAEGKVRSIAIAVVRDGRIVWEEAFGQQATTGTMYTLASTGKSITGTAILELARQGKLDLDRSALDYLAPGELTMYEGKPSQVTLRALLRMNIAIPHLWWHHWTDDTRAHLSNAEVLRRYAIVVAPPDDGFYYSNMTFGVLAQVAEDEEHADFAQVVEKTVFAPLGMTHSSLRPDARFEPWLTASYGSDGTRRAYAYSDPEGGAGYRASIHDLIVYARHHLEGDLGRMHTTTNGYYAGWGHIDDASGIRFAIANGGIVGAASEIRLLPRKKIAVACLTNTTGADVSPFVNAAIKAMEPRWQARIDIPPDDLPVTTAPEWIGSWPGEIVTWERRIPATMNIASNGITISIGGALSRLRWNAGFLRGETPCEVPLSDAKGQPTKCDVALRLTDGRWTGSVRVISTGPRSDFSLPTYAGFHR